MKKKLALKGDSIVRAHERLAVLSVSIPIHTEHSAASEALRLIYAEALLSGSGTYTRDAFIDTLNLLGSSIRVYTEDDTIEVSLSSVDTSLQKTLQLLEAMLTSPAFTPKELGRIKRYLTNSLSLAKEDARTAAYQQFASAILPQKDRRYPYSIDTLLAHLKSITVGDLRRFHKELWKHEWLYTCGGSTTSVTRMEKLVKKLAKKVAVHDEHFASLPVPMQKGRSILLTDIPNKQNIEFSLGAVLPLYPTDRSYAAFVFGMSVLALQGGFSGRLMSTVREKEGLTYMIYGKSEKSTVREHGFWRISTFFNPKDVLTGITSTIREITRMQREGITEDEHRRFRAILKTRSALRNDSLIKQVGELHARSEAGLTEEEYAAYKHALETVSIAEVNAVMNTHLDPERLVVSGAGPIRKVESDLRKFEIV